ncbi:surface carbohydrate biosynthesis protein [Methylopila sp. M107]|uniref:surface carbohydrate biosynthesis protein n=1 Tax=Methylopila sp. M107 TaxID=1101190 RepID=UPI0003A26A28|nr:surface carbohydrate biosynthesis protein [Methylopila sp. M107]
MSVGRHIILPVETAARELDAKLLLGVHAAQRGLSATVGVKAHVNVALDRLERGLFLSPNFHRSSDRTIATAANLGHRVAAWDEEGLVWRTPESYRARRASRPALSGVETLFAWGPQQADALKPALRGLDAEMLLAGNPRADLLRPEFRARYRARADALRAEFGDDFILINSNFGQVNHLLGHGRTENGGRSLDAISARTGHALGYLEHRLALFQAFAALIPRIAERFPGRRIVIRPHPDEAPSAWAKAASSVPGAIVRFDGDLLPWLIGASHIVHNGCTTAIEAALLGRAAISYRPFVADEHEIPQPRVVGLEAGGADELIAMLADATISDRPPQEARAALAGLIASCDGPTASERIVDELEAMLARPKAPPSPLRRMAGHAAILRRRFSQHRRRGVANSSVNPLYYGHKFPPVPTAQIEERVRFFAEALAFRAPKVQEMSDRIYRLTPA